MTLTYDFDLAHFDFATIHTWMALTYWSAGISRERVEQGFRASALCVGAFHEGKQVGTARCVSDTTRFAYVADVYVEEAYRRQGIAPADGQGDDGASTFAGRGLLVPHHAGRAGRLCRTGLRPHHEPRTLHGLPKEEKWLNRPLALIASSSSSA